MMDIPATPAMILKSANNFKDSEMALEIAKLNSTALCQNRRNFA